MALRQQKPSAPNNWLYQEQDGGKRIFRQLIYLGITATKWNECSDEEKIKWETDNPTLVEGYEEPKEDEGQD